VSSDKINERRSVLSQDWVQMSVRKKIEINKKEAQINRLKIFKCRMMYHTALEISGRMDVVQKANYLIHFG
jgi:hypothetical protein